MHHLRIFLAALVVAAAVVAARPVTLRAHEHAQPAASPEPSRAAAQEHATTREPEKGAEANGSGWLAVIAKAFNFALLAGVLVYFLRTPLTDYLSGRIVKVREDLVTAAQTRETATRQLADIHEKLAALPKEIEALKARGTEEIAAERIRIDQAAEAEREPLIAGLKRLSAKPVVNSMELSRSPLTSRLKQQLSMTSRVTIALFGRSQKSARPWNVRFWKVRPSPRK